MTKSYRTIEGDTLDNIAWQHYGRHNGTTELLYDANPGLSKHPLYLPDGLIITLPELEDDLPEQTVKLYD